jgi:hypothetical protein
MILSPEEIDYAGIDRPSVVVALGPEGVARRKKAFEGLDETSIVLQVAGVDVPVCRARLHRVDLKAQGIKGTDWALASLGVLAKLGQVIRPEMLRAALEARLKGEALSSALKLVEGVETGEWVQRSFAIA